MAIGNGGRVVNVDEPSGGPVRGFLKEGAVADNGE